MSKIQPRRTASRSERNIALALFHASFSKDPNTQVGCVIVNDDNELISTGYNGPCKYVDDNKINWSRDPDEYGLRKYDLINHAENNALRYARGRAKNCTLYVTGLPCSDCMNDIITEGVKQVVYLEHKSDDPKSLFNNPELFKKTTRIAQLGGVELVKFNGNLKWAKDWVANWPDLVDHSPKPVHNYKQCISIMYISVGEYFEEMWSGEQYKLLDKSNLSEIRLLRLSDNQRVYTTSAMKGRIIYIHQPLISPLLDPLSGK